MNYIFSIRLDIKLHQHYSKYYWIYIQKYNKEYVEKITLKKSFINENKNKILSFYDIKQSENWKTEALFVTSKHQFNIPNIVFPIISINDLDEKIKNDFLDI